MKVLHLIDTLEIGGAEQSLVATLPRLRGVDSVVCQLYPGSTLGPALAGAGIRVLSLQLPGKYALFRACQAVARIVREERPDLLHATLFRAGMVARVVGALRRVPVIDSFVADSYARERCAGLGVSGRAKLRAVQALDRVTAPLVAEFLAVSRAVLRANCRALGVAERRCRVIPRGRDPALFAGLAPEARVSLRRTLGWGEEAEVILCVARLLRSKGQEHLVRALPAVLAQRPRAVLALVGDGPARPACAALARELGVDARVVLLGTREDVPVLLQAADLFAFPSLCEGIGGALVEAMLAGLPVVAADTPALRENVEPGATGLLVPPGDPAAIAAAVVRLLQDGGQSRALGERAQAVARVRFSVERVARQYEDCYREVAGSVSA